MRKPVNSADSVSMTMHPTKYMQGTRDYVIYYEDHNLDVTKDQPMELSSFIKLVSSDSRSHKVAMQGGEMLNFFPTKKLKITVNKKAVLKSGTVAPGKADEIVDVMRWSLRKNTLMKADLVLLDVIATNAANGWNRPIYWAITTGSEAYLNMMPYLQMDGLTYRLVPIKKKNVLDDRQPGRIDTDIMYANLMGKFTWGGLESEEDMWVDFVMMRQCKNFRNIFIRLAYALMVEASLEEQEAAAASPDLESGDKTLVIDKKARAVEVLDYGLKVIPEHLVPYDAYMGQYSQLYYQLEQPDKGFELDSKLANYLISEIKWYELQDKKWPSS
jgi:hypothetical protein